MHKRRRKEDTLVFTRHNGPARERNRDTGHSRECQSGTRKLGGHEGTFWVLEMPWNLTWMLVTQMFYLHKKSAGTIGPVCFTLRTRAQKVLWKKPQNFWSPRCPGENRNS